MSLSATEKEGLPVEGGLQPIQAVGLKSPQANAMLTPECWELILTNLDSVHFLAAINSAPEWNQIMRHRKTTKLLPLVIPILAKYIPASSLLAARGIIKATNVEVLEFLNTKPRAGEMEFCSSNLNEVRSRYIFRTPEVISRFMNLMTQRPIPGANPFSSSLVKFLIGEDIGLARESILTLLSVYGSYINEAIFQAPLDIIHAEGVTFDSLSFLPNIKTLHINVGLSNDLQNFRRGVYLPPLPQLSELYIGSSSGVGITLDGRSDLNEVEFGLRLLREYGSQLRSVSLGWVLGDSSIDVDMLNSLMPKLSSLQVEHVHYHVLRKLLGVKWQLEELIFGSWLRPRFCEWKAKEMMQVISNFSPTLCKLGMILGGGDEQWGFRDSILLPVPKDLMKPLPKLKMMTVQLPNLEVEWFWEFLEISCQNLEEVHIMGGVRWSTSALDRTFAILPRLSKIDCYYSNVETKVTVVRGN